MFEKNRFDIGVVSIQMLNEAPSLEFQTTIASFDWFVVISFKLLKSNIATGKMHL